MLITIIIPVYNIERYLKMCVDSILMQDVRDFELLLINDGSTDNSGAICDEYALKDDRIKVFHQKNAGVSAARNIGLKKSNGDWICFVDGDDQLEKDSLMALMNKIEQEETEILIAKSWHFENGKKQKEKYSFDTSFLDRSFGGYELIAIKGYKRGSVWGCIFNKAFLGENDLKFPLGLRNGEDSIFISLCHLFAQKICFANTDFYLVTEREGSASRNWTFERVLKMVDNLKFINGFIRDNPNLTSSQRAILDYNRYGTVSAIYNNFYFCFSWKGMWKLRREVKIALKEKIAPKEIKTSKAKVNILNFSLDIFVFMVLINQWWRYRNM